MLDDNKFSFDNSIIPCHMPLMSYARESIEFMMMQFDCRPDPEIP